MHDQSNRRRVPQQARGQRRVEQILAAADSLIAEIGYENATTNAIAARAETSIGSLYQFFDNKEAILAALTERYREALHAHMTHALQGRDNEPELEQEFATLISALYTYYQAHPGFQAVLYGSLTSSALRDAAQQLVEEVYAPVERILAAHLPDTNDGTRQQMCQILVTLTRALLPLTTPAASPQRDPAEVLDEVTRLSMAYLGIVQNGSM